MSVTVTTTVTTLGAPLTQIWENKHAEHRPRCRVNVLRENLLLQHVAEPTRQRGTDKPHTLDLIISSDNFVSDVEYLSPLGMSDHSLC